MHYTEQVSSHHASWRNRLVWMLIVALLNPAAIVPMSLYSSSAVARDTDIYLNVAGSSSTIPEPQVLLVLDTSDSMNVPEPWREYDPNKYDSHVEYLWNSPSYINTIGTGDPALGLPTAGSSGGTMVYAGNSNASADGRTMRYDSGWWSRKGYDKAALSGTALRDAARAYANGTQTGDPGPRKLYRHYAWSNSRDCGEECRWRGGGMFLYWVPLEGRDANDASIENDPRLRSDSFNKLWGTAAINTTGNTNPLNWPVTRGGVMFGYAPGNGADPHVDYRNLNRCQSSVAALEPSTVYAPSAQPKNMGKMLNQRWVRWGRYLGLNDTRAQFGNADHISTGTGWRGSDTKITNQSNGNEYFTGYLNGQRDANDWGNCRYANPVLPVRTKIDNGTEGSVDPGDSYAGWGTLAADYGGNTFAWYRTSHEYGGNPCEGWSGSAALLENAMRIYYPDTSTYPMGNNLGEAHFYLKKYFPVPEYYDSSASLSITTGGSAGTRVTKTRYCRYNDATTVYDARGNTRKHGGSCVAYKHDDVTGSDDNCNDQAGSCRCSSNDADACASVSNPSACGLQTETTEFYSRDNKSCAWSAERSSISKDFHGCGWSGRGHVNIEGVGDIYYGGSCIGSCTGAACPAAVDGGTNYCNATTSGSVTLAGVTYANSRNDEGGCSDKSDVTYYYGGDCKGQKREVSSPYTALPGEYETNRSSACNKSTEEGELRINGTEYEDWRTDNGGCSDKADTNLTCAGAGFTCSKCEDRSSEADVGTTAGSSTTYTVYNRAATGYGAQYFDCKDDDGGTGNPGNSYLRDSWTRPASFGREFEEGSNTPGNNNHPYSTNAAHAIPDGNIPPINVYHPNYLNWKFGAKACRTASGGLITNSADLGEAITCRPIGRKTRLQIAKDALTDLINETDGVRFGLMVFNKLDTNINTQGGHIAKGIKPMGATCKTTPTADCANRTALIAKINGLVAKSQTPLTEVMYEAYRYFAGERPYFGTNGSAGVLASTATARDGTTVTEGRDPDVVNGAGYYISPMLANPSIANPAPCQKNYVVLISDGGPENDTGADAVIQAIETDDLTGISVLQETTSQQFEKNNEAAYTNCPAGNSPYCPTDIGASSNYVWLDELTNFMAKADVNKHASMPGAQDVRTYTIGFAGGSSEVLRHAGEVWGGPGKYRDAEDSEGLARALKETFAAIRDWNPTGSSGAVPISSFNRSEHANDIFVSFFGPDNSTAWDGTVKKYKISNSATECGHDADARPVKYCFTGRTDLGGGLRNIEKYLQDPDTGLRAAEINSKAVSHWSSTVLGQEDGARSNAGGTGYVLKQTTTPAGRLIYTHITGESELDLTDEANVFSTENANITSGMLGAANATERNTLINFLRGGNPAICTGDTADCNDASAWRSWPHHDVLHSRPSILLYEALPDADPEADANGDGRADNDLMPVQHLFYLSNDGVLHAVDTETGVEQWAFVVEEVLPQAKAILSDANGQEHLIGADGSPVLYVRDIAHVDGTAGPDGKITSHDMAYLVFGLRRGGRAYYALDVSHYDEGTHQVSPRLLWKASHQCGGDSNCIELPELGESWSSPSIVKLHADSTQPTVVFGGGYDPATNDMLQATIARVGGVATVSTKVPHGYRVGDSVMISGAVEDGYNGTHMVLSVTGDTFTYAVADSLTSPAAGQIRVINTEPTRMGRGVFFVKMDGNLLYSFTPADGSATNRQVAGMNYSIPADTVALNADMDAGGYADRLYMGDLGGQLWRFDLNTVDPEDWIVSKLADLTGADTPKRKLFFPPAVVKQQSGTQIYDAVYIGTGDWQNPMRKDGVDKFFMIKDFGTGFTPEMDTSETPVPITNVYNSTSALLPFYNIDENKIRNPDESISTQAATDLSAARGWVMTLNAVEGKAGEKAVNAPTVLSGKLRFGTYLPDYSSCVPGRGIMYVMNATDGTPVADHRALLNTFYRGFPPATSVVMLFKKRLLVTTPGDGGIGSDTPCVGEDCGAGDAPLYPIMEDKDIGVGIRSYWYQEPE